MYILLSVLVGSTGTPNWFSGMSPETWQLNLPAGVHNTATLYAIYLSLDDLVLALNSATITQLPLFHFEKLLEVTHKNLKPVIIFMKSFQMISPLIRVIFLPMELSSERCHI